MKARITGKALERIPETVNTIPLIIQHLREKIKPESSKVIEGRLAALRADKQSLQNFSKTAEELAEGLRRVLIIEGVTYEKANEMSIDKTVRMCRASARTDLARAVIASTKFTDPREVISSFVVEVGRELEERQVLAYRTNKQNRGNFNQNRNNRGTRGRNYFHNNNQNSQNNDRQQNGNRGRGGNSYRGNRGGYNNYNGNNNN